MDATLSAPIGELLDGRYLVESHIARGGMATVYVARDVRLERTVALKIAHPELARDREFVDRFIGEARAVARLSSPNVVAVFDQGSTGDLHYIAMEYVPGPTLRELLVSRGRLAPREALDIIERVLSGLGVAHDAGIIHRDVKPENVLLGNGTAVKVADFGLARAESGISHTRSGLLIGTAAYLAPEQVTSNAADQRTDVYAAGVMLFEMLTGQQPHKGETPLAVAYQHVNSVVPAPSSVHPELPPALDALVALGTSRDPDLRPADARHYLNAIREVRRGMPPPLVARRDLPVSGPPAQPADWTLPAPGAATLAGAARSGGSMAANRTLVVPVGEEPDLTGGYQGGRGRPYREPRLQRWLFSHRIVIVLGVVVVVLAASGLAWWLAAGQYTSVPPVAGMTISTARGDLANAGLHAILAPGRNSYSVAAGQVISTDPAAGSQIGHGGTVRVIPSLGPVLVTMPPVTGEQLSQAEQAVKADHLKLSRPSYQTSTSIQAGLVISSDPPAYQHWPKDKPVHLVVSDGQPLPNFVGQQVAIAQAEAAAGGYSINPVPDSTSPQPAGIVTGQSPSPGTPITSGEVVSLEVSTGQGSPGGQGEVAIPDVQGLTASQAQSVLQSAGFNVQVSQGLIGQTVTSYSPTGEAPPGTTITITVGFL
jgi:eukaryotic-like serine/threonine-protein kinase